MLRALFLSTLALVLFAIPSVHAQLSPLPGNVWKPAVLDQDRGRATEIPVEAEVPSQAMPRPRLLCMPLDLAGDPAERDHSEGRLRVRFGEASRFLEVRRPGDPGGAGYQKLQSELHVFDNGTTGLRVGLQALRPSGAEWDGLNDGPTIVSPTVAVVQELGQGTAVQGFLGKDLRPGTPWTEGLERNLQYGMALQTPMPLTGKAARAGMVLFVEALGRYRHENDGQLLEPVAWEVLPGLHWRRTEHWWISGGVLLPVGPGRADSELLHFNCSLQF
jgi:hypothetical protein